MKFKHIKPNYNKKIEVYNSIDEQMLDDDFASNFRIKSLKQIGSGGQADVYKCELATSIDETQICVDKMHKVYNNPEMAIEKFREMYKEFKIGCMLKHPAIV